MESRVVGLRRAGDTTGFGENSPTDPAASSSRAGDKGAFGTN